MSDSGRSMTSEYYAQDMMPSRGTYNTKNLSKVGVYPIEGNLYDPLDVAIGREIWKEKKQKKEAEIANIINTLKSESVDKQQQRIASSNIVLNVLKSKMLSSQYVCGPQFGKFIACQEAYRAVSPDGQLDPMNFSCVSEERNKEKCKVKYVSTLKSYCEKEMSQVEMQIVGDEFFTQSEKSTSVHSLFKCVSRPFRAIRAWAHNDADEFFNFEQRTPKHPISLPTWRSAPPPKRDIFSLAFFWDPQHNAYSKKHKDIMPQVADMEMSPGMQFVKELPEELRS